LNHHNFHLQLLPELSTVSYGDRNWALQNTIKGGDCGATI
jgi:hypothetical protein